MPVERAVSSLPLAGSTIELLSKKGFRHTSDLEGMRPLELARELDVTAEVALGIIRSLTAAQQSV